MSEWSDWKQRALAAINAAEQAKADGSARQHGEFLAEATAYALMAIATK